MHPEETMMSKYPDISANGDWGDEWQESNKICPDCNNVFMWEAGWWDDSPEDGGACIGTQYKCGNCGYRDNQ